MEFTPPLIKATLIKRYKRFFADATLDNGIEITAHCPNTGTMRTCGDPGDTIYLMPNDSPKRKLKYTWELTRKGEDFVGINTHRTNKIVAEALANGTITELQGYRELKSEVKYKDSRLDFCLDTCSNNTTHPIAKASHHRCWVEVKNATLLEGDICMFPDAVTTRGLKHLHRLTELVANGDRAVMLYVVNRSNGKELRPAHHIDPTYAEALVNACAAGVEIYAYRNIISEHQMLLHGSVPLNLTGTS